MMKRLKLIVIALAILLVAILTAPLWGGCNITYSLCSSWCEIKHFNSSFKSTACKGSCAADKVACLAK